MNGKDIRTDYSELRLIRDLDSFADDYSVETVSGVCNRFLELLKKDVEIHGARHIIYISKVANRSIDRFFEHYAGNRLKMVNNKIPLTKGLLEEIRNDHEAERILMRTMSKMAGILIRHENKGL